MFLKIAKIAGRSFNSQFVFCLFFSSFICRNGWECETDSLSVIAIIEAIVLLHANDMVKVMKMFHLLSTLRAKSIHFGTKCYILSLSAIKYFLGVLESFERRKKRRWTKSY